MLLLKRHLVELVRAGKKRQTLRLWTHRMVKAGQVTYSPGLGRLRIDSIEEVAGLEALTDADAVADGFADLPALLAELAKIYGAPSGVVMGGKRLYRLKFTWPVEGEKVVPEGGEVGGKVAQPCGTKRVAPVPAPRRGAAKRVKKDPVRTNRRMTVAQRQVLKSYVLQAQPSGT